MGVDPQTEVADLYVASYARLVAFVGAVVQDRDLAQEAVQDAFVRLLGQWGTVSRYDDPQVWLRKVALGFALNRRRKARNTVKAWRRHGPAPHTPPPSGDAVDVDRALAALPTAQRAVLLLQHLGLRVEEIADHLDVPVGTVKSRLSRARAAMQPLLQEENDHA